MAAVSVGAVRGVGRRAGAERVPPLTTKLPGSTPSGTRIRPIASRCRASSTRCIAASAALRSVVLRDFLNSLPWKRKRARNTPFFLPRFAMVVSVWLDGHLVPGNARFRETAHLPHGDTRMPAEALLRHR